MTAHVDDNLAFGLKTTVPLRIQEIRDWTAERRANDAAWVVELMRSGAAGDELLYGTQDGRPAAAFAALARGLAALAFEPGGVTFAGLHWCTTAHEGCPSRPVWVHLSEVSQ